MKRWPVHIVDHQGRALCGVRPLLTTSSSARVTCARCTDAAARAERRRARHRRRHAA